VLKKETRIIGLSAPRNHRKKIPIIGIVYRGSYWLDGIVTYTLDRADPTYLSGLATAIMTSKQYSQIHAVISSRPHILPQGFIDFALLAEEINIPVIVVSRARRHTPGKFMKVKSSRNSTSIWTHKQYQEKVNDLFMIGCAGTMNIPEAVRVADLIATQL